MTSALDEKPRENPNPNKVQLATPICVAYGHPNLEEIHQYLSDFGLLVVYIAEQTAEPAFLGVFFEAASRAELLKASKLAGASEARDFMYGGQVVDITDVSGMPFHVVWSMQKRPYTPRENEIESHNYPAPNDEDSMAKPRCGRFHRLSYGAIPVHKLGHCGYIPSDIDASLKYHCTNFNYKPSDVFVLPPKGKVFIAFMDLDLGICYSDHHSFFLASPGSGSLQVGRPHHAAFEMKSIDVNFIGHGFLEEKGYKPFWGVGRHILRSQVYDYWFDLDGFVAEHYADGIWLTRTLR